MARKGGSKQAFRTRGTDFVYLENPGDEVSTTRLFDEWVTTVTTTAVDDNVNVRDFRENAFWRRIDYAMHDDFPTINTDLLCTLEDGTEITVQLDISWNLPVPVSPVGLDYRPLNGPAFRYPRTVPVPLQLSWKMHQSVVGPRTKDLVDVILLLRAYQLNDDERRQTREAFAEECKKDGFSPTRLQLYTKDRLARYFEIECMDLIPSREPFEWRELEEEVRVLSDRLADLFDLAHLHHFFVSGELKFSSKADLVRAYAKALIDSGLG